MISKAKAIKHGPVALRYVMEKRRAEYLRGNLLPVDTVTGRHLDHDDIWAHFCQTRRVFGKQPERDTFRVEIAPTPGESRGWTRRDWLRLLDDWVTRMDRLALYSDKMRNGKCRLLARPTMIARSQYVAVVHHDTVKPHIHVVINRVTMDGKVSDSNEIMRRSALVAEAINRERGWTSAVDVRAERAADIRAAALDILRAMPRYDFALYARAMDERGYRLSVKQDSNGRPAHYTVCCGRSRFRASDLPRRDLTVAHLPQTWARLHGIRDSPTLARFTDETADFGTIAHENGQRDTTTSHEYSPRVPCVSAEKAERQESREIPETMYSPERATPPLTAVEAEADGRSYSVLLPEAAYAAMRDECCDIADETDDFCDIDRALMPLAAVLWQSATLAGGLAAIYFEAATDIQPACGGGSSSQSLKRDDDDDMESLARRAARRAAYHYGITPRRRSRGRGR